MTPEEEKPKVRSGLKPKELCDLIKSCADAGVALLKLGDFEVSFHQPVERKPINQVIDPPRPTIPAETAISEPNQIQVTAKRLEGEEKRVRLDQLAEMMLTDPLGYEELIKAGELEDERIHSG